MNKVHIVLALFSMSAVGFWAFSDVNKTASAIGTGNSVAASVFGKKAKSFNFTDASAAINDRMGFELETTKPSAAVPFPSFVRPKAARASVKNPAGFLTEGVAALNPINNSGIRALLSVKRTGQSETIEGFAANLDPNKTYISFLYDAGAPGGGPCACIPSNPPPASMQTTCATTQAPQINFNQMVVGYWQPLTGSSTRTLQIVKSNSTNGASTSSFVPLENIGAISIREDTQNGQPLPAAIDVSRFQLRGCGKFKVDMN
jgi:hypothetical protein